MNTDYKMNEEKMTDYQKYEQTIRTLHKRFRTYGYKRIKTSTFEQYDLYSKVRSSLDQNEMIKVIDRSGQVLVLRPDVTIPITRQLAEEFTVLSKELRYFYVQDIFRQSTDPEEGIESTQAGVEYYCESSPEADAEVIALACHALKDLGFIDIKIEIGHAAFFKQLIEGIDLTPTQLTQLKKAIQSKNVVDIESLLTPLSIDQEISEAIKMIPFLYGNPADVSKKARTLVNSSKLNGTLDYLMKVNEILTIYGLENNIALDLGLINHMDYYSDIIFQGYVGKFGKPVLMGGRYDDLGNEFGANLPAIGFACEVESLVQASENDNLSQQKSLDVKISYDTQDLSTSIIIANELRERNYLVQSAPSSNKNAQQLKSVFQIHLRDGEKVFQYNENQTPFSDITELLTLITETKGRK